MDRIYNTGDANDVTMFIGNEVEHSPAFGLRTLFVVGIQDVNNIKKDINDSYTHLNKSMHIKHVYLGANQSFNPECITEWDLWNDVISELLTDSRIYVTLDFDVKHAQDIHEYVWTENNRFIPMISVKIPYVKLYNYNTTIKLDDVDFDSTNPGVWCHSLHNLQDRTKFTPWSKYTEDEIVK